MTKKIALAVAALVVGLAIGSSPAKAVDSFATGNDFWNDCREDPSWQSFCYAYSIAIANIMSEAAVKGFRACFPTGVTSGQTKDVVLKFLGDHPELRQYSIDSLIPDAFATAWPCRS